MKAHIIYFYTIKSISENAIYSEKTTQHISAAQDRFIALNGCLKEA